MLLRFLTLIHRSRMGAVACIIGLSLVTLVIQMNNLFSDILQATPDLIQVQPVKYSESLNQHNSSSFKSNYSSFSSNGTSTDSIYRSAGTTRVIRVQHSPPTRDICPIVFNTTECFFEVNSHPSEKISRESTGRVIRYIYKFRQGDIFCNKEKIFKWRTTGNLVLVHVESTCKVLDTLILPHKDRDGSSKKQDASLRDFLEKLPHKAIILSALYADTTTYSRVLSEFGLQRKFIAQMVYRRGIVVFQLRKGYLGHSVAVVNPRGGGNNTILQRHFQIGHSFSYNTDPLAYGTVVQKHPELHSGGHWTPQDCSPRWRIAIIIPFRQREQHLWTFLENMFRFLQLQKLEFTIFVIEQAGDVLFNRASLMNIGYLEAKKLGDFQCYAFHDVDQVPEDLANFYGCSDMPRHLVVTRSVTDFKLKMKNYFGGAIMMRPEHIEKINGFPNRIFGWGGEDDEIWARVVHVGMRVLRYPIEIARYRSLSHGVDISNPHIERKTMEIFNSIPQFIKKDGLNSMNYDVISIEKRAIYTHVIVHFPGPASMEEIKPIVNLPTTTSPPPPPAAQAQDDVEVDRDYNNPSHRQDLENPQLRLLQIRELLKNLPTLPPRPLKEEEADKHVRSRQVEDYSE